MKNFKLTDETKTLDNGIILHRIECISEIPGKPDVKVGDKGGWVEKESNIDSNAWVYGNAEVYGNARVCGDVEIQSYQDYIVFKNWWSSGRYFTWTRSNNMWRVGCFYGTGEELVAKAYKDSEKSGREYERVVKYVQSILDDELKQ